MKLWKTVAVSATLMSLCFAPACNKKENKPQPEQPPAVAAQAAPASWNVEEVNGLLREIPKDTPMAYVSTRNFDIHSPVMKKIMDFAKAYLKATVNIMDKMDEGISEAVTPEMKAFLNDYIALLDDPVKMLKDWGIDAERNESVFYLDNGKLIIKQSVANAALLQDKLAEVLTKLNAVVAKDNADNKNELIQADKGDFIQVKSIESQGTTWKKYTLALSQAFHPEKFRNALSNFYVNFGNSFVTIIFYAGDIADQDLQYYIKTPEKSLTKDDLGVISKDTIAVGFMDNMKIFDMMADNGIIRDIASNLEIDLSDICMKEYREIVAAFPKVVMVNSTADSEFISRSTLVMSNKELVKKLGALKAQSKNTVNQDTLAAFKLNMNFAAAYNFAKDIAQSFKEKKYQCGTLELLNDIPEVFEMAKEIETQGEGLLQNISGVNINMTKLDLSEEDNINFEGVANITGKNIPKAIELIEALVGPQMATMKALALPAKAGDVKKINLSTFVPTLKNTLDVAYSDSDIFVVTEPLDVNKYMTLPNVENHNFIEFDMGTKLYSMIYMMQDESLKDAFNDVPKVLYKTGMGADDQGLTFDTSIQL